jgi:hypothetical protein
MLENRENEKMESCKHDSRKPVPGLYIDLCISCLDYRHAIAFGETNDLARRYNQSKEFEAILKRESDLRHGTLKVTVYAPAQRRDGIIRKKTPINTGKTPAQRAAMAEWFRVAGTK